MTAGRFLLGAASVLTAVLLQTAVVARLPLPGGPADLALVLVIAYAWCEGPLSGMVTGFVTGLLADLLTDHQLGRLALAYVVVGYLAGIWHDDTERSTLPLLVVGAGAALALGVYAAEGLLLGDPRTGLAAVLRGLTSSVGYDIVLAPFVVPVIGRLVRRVDHDPVRR